MNHIYQSIWNPSLQSWVAVPEYGTRRKTKSKDKLKKFKVFLSLATLSLYSFTFSTSLVAQVNCTTGTCNVSDNNEPASASGSGVVLNLTAPTLSINGSNEAIKSEFGATINIKGDSYLESSAGNIATVFAKDIASKIVFEQNLELTSVGNGLASHNNALIHVKGNVNKSTNSGTGQLANLYAASNGNIIIDGDLNAVGSNANSTSVVSAVVSGQITITGKATLTSGLSTNSSLIFSNSNSQINIGSLDATFQSSDTKVAGVLALDGGKVTISDNSDIRMKSGVAIQAVGNGSLISMNDLIIETITADTKISQGIWATETGQVSVEKVQITMDGVLNQALSADKNSKITINDLATLSLTGDNSIGALANASSIRTNNGLVITTNGVGSDGIQVINGGTFTNTNGLKINVQGAPAASNAAQCGSGAAICLSQDSSSFTSNGAGFINSTGNAIQLKDGANQVLNLSDLSLNTSSSSLALIATNAVKGASEISLTNSTATASNGGEGLLLNAENGSEFSMTADKTNLFGDIKADAGSTVQLNLKNGSYLKGAIDPIHLNISSNSQWDITGSSELSNFSNAGIANFVPSSTNSPQTLKVAQYAGGGSLGLNTYLNAGVGSSDMLEIETAGTVMGTSTIRILDTKGLAVLPSGNGVMVVSADPSATADASFKLSGGSVAAGIYEYSLQKNTDGNWYLNAQDVDNGPLPVDPQNNGSRPNYNSTVSSIVALASIAQIYNNSTLGTWRERVGGMAYSDITAINAATTFTAPLWVRAVYEKGQMDGGQRFQATPSSDVYAPSLDYHTSFLQIGSDIYRKPHENGSHQTAGLFMTFGTINADVSHFTGSNGKRSVYGGSAKIKNYSAGGYWTYIAPTGSYLDVVGQYTKHSLDGHGAAGSLDGHGRTWAASIEAGKAYAITDTNWNLIPQAQLRYSDVRLNRINAHASNSVVGAYQFGDNDSLEMRLGLEARYRNPVKKPNHPQQGAWMRLDLLHESKGKNTATYIPASGTGEQPVFTSSRHGSALDLVGGIDLPITPVTSIYSSAGYRHGLGDNKGHAWRADVGLRWVF